MKQRTNKSILLLAQMAVLTALSVVSVMMIHLPIVPAATFLEYDIADIFILLAGLLFGSLPGMAVLLVTCLIQALTVSAGSGVYGFVMHLAASGMLVLPASLMYNRAHRKPEYTFQAQAPNAALTALTAGLLFCFGAMAGGMAWISRLVKALAPGALLSPPLEMLRKSLPPAAIAVFALLIFCAALLYRRQKAPFRLILALLAGSAAMVLVMIPMNLLVTPRFLGTPAEVVRAMLPTAILPFNLLKAGLNSALTFLLFRAVYPVLERSGLLGKM